MTGADEDEQRIRATYGTNFERLIEIKKVYDADNMFRVSRNITPPARATGSGKPRQPQVDRVLATDPGARSRLFASL